ncbi:hypothetical protein QWA68_004310 [Fusarium oxysporum]|nr:hypothetical protein QWA68_004310 [Fusarium oxysporum]
MISQALFENETSLEILSFTRVNDREFVGFENKNYPKSNNSTDINAVEVSLKRPRPNEPMEVFWRPARGIIIQFETGYRNPFRPLDGYLWSMLDG